MIDPTADPSPPRATPPDDDETLAAAMARQSRDGKVAVPPNDYDEDTVVEG